MVSKIIEKEKARQEEILKNLNLTKNMFWQTVKTQHKQSLINLKEYMEELPITKRTKEDMPELNKLIERYA